MTPKAAMLVLACSVLAPAADLKVVRFAEQPMAKCRTVLLVRQKLDPGGFNGPVPGDVLDHLSELTLRFRKELADALRAAGFEPRSDPESGQPCDLRISIRVGGGKVLVRNLKAPAGWYYEAVNLRLELTYGLPAAGEIGVLRAKLRGKGDSNAELKDLAERVAAFTASKAGV